MIKWRGEVLSMICRRRSLVEAHALCQARPRDEGTGLMAAELQLSLLEEGAEAERLDDLAGLLRRELLQLDVDDVTRLPAGAAPPASRAVDASAVGGLLVSLGHAAGRLKAVIQAVERWLARGQQPRTVRVEIDGEVLELSNASAADQSHLVELFITRHSAVEGTR
jgi:hypothetical protein